MMNSSKVHFGILQYAAIIPIPGKELQTSAEIVTFSLFDLTGVRFPKERIRKGLKGSLRVSLTHCLCQSEKYGAGGEVTFFNFASNRSKWTKRSESAFFFQFKCRKVLQKN